MQLQFFCQPLSVVKWTFSFVNANKNFGYIILNDFNTSHCFDISFVLSSFVARQIMKRLPNNVTIIFFFWQMEHKVKSDYSNRLFRSGETNTKYCNNVTKSPFVINLKISTSILPIFFSHSQLSSAERRKCKNSSTTKTTAQKKKLRTDTLNSIAYASHVCVQRQWDAFKMHYC